MRVKQIRKITKPKGKRKGNKSESQISKQQETKKRKKIVIIMKWKKKKRMEINTGEFDERIKEREIKKATY